MDLVIEPLIYPLSEQRIIDWATIMVDLMEDDGIETVHSLVDSYQRNWKKRADKRKNTLNEEFQGYIPNTEFIAYNGHGNPIGIALIQYRINYSLLKSTQKKVQKQDTGINDIFSILPRMCYFYVHVLDAHKRKGVGTSLLSHMQQALKGSSVNRIFTFAESEEAVLFLSNKGGTMTEEGFVYQLKLNEFDPTNIVNNKKSNIGDLQIEIYTNPGIDIYEKFVDVYNLSKQHEPGSDSFERLNNGYTSEELFNTLKSGEDNQIFAIPLIKGSDQSKTKAIGISHVFISNSYPERGFQKYTGVHPDFTNQGVATILKSKLYTYLQTKFPKLQSIETESVVNNVSSIRVNTKLGYVKTRPQDTFEFQIN